MVILLSSIFITFLILKGPKFPEVNFQLFQDTYENVS